MKTEGNPVGKDGQLGKAAVADSAESEIDRLVAAGKFKQAVELAKERHKRVNTPATERRLVEVYMGRIEQFQNKGMAQDAQTLLNLVRDRFPNQRHQLVSTEIRAAAAGGRIGDLVKPLAGEGTPPEARAIIETTIRQHVTDLPALAATDALPAEHPLRVGAAAAWKAFEAVTSRAVTDAEIALPEISHRNPLAGWKMLVRAIAGFYRDDNEGARRSLDAVAPDSAAARMTPMVRALLDRAKPTTGLSAVLYGRVLPDSQALRKALSEVETSFKWRDPAVLERWVKEAVRLCAAHHPDLLDRLRQHIVASCVGNQFPLESALALVPSTRITANFWRLLARVALSTAPQAITALYWERFLRHAVDEQMFDANSAEAATVWLNIAQILAPAPPKRLEQTRRKLGKKNLISKLYDGQPPDIARVRPASDQQLFDSLLLPGSAFSHAAATRPESQTFKEWWAWALRVELPVKQKEDIAQKWHIACPREGQPLVILSELAEGRKALTMALKRISEAEAIDPLNPQVRQARLRLTLSIAWRHFQNAQLKMIAGDLAELDALPGMVEGDRAAVLASIRGAWHLLRDEKEPAAQCFNAVVERMGKTAGPPIFDSIMVMARLPKKIEKPALPEPYKSDRLEIAQAMARIIKLADDLTLKILRPAAWDSEVEAVLRQRPCPLSHAELLMLSAAAVSRRDWEQANLATGAGLVRADVPSLTARFLLHRGRAMIGQLNTARAFQCLVAALELARQAHDEELIATVFAVIEQDSRVRRIIDWSTSRGERLTSQTLAQIVEAEREAKTAARGRSGKDPVTYYTRSQIDGSMYGMDIWGFGDNADEDDEWDEDDDDWEDDDDGEYDDSDDDDADELNLGLFNPPPPGRSGAGGSVPAPTLKEMQELFKQLNLEAPKTMEDTIKDPRKLIEAMAKAMGQQIGKSDLEDMTQQLNDMVNGPGGKPPENPPDPPWKTPRKGRRP